MAGARGRQAAASDGRGNGPGAAAPTARPLATDCASVAVRHRLPMMPAMPFDVIESASVALPRTTACV